MTSSDPITPEAQERMERLLLALLDSGPAGLPERALRDATRPMTRNDYSWAKLRCRRARLIRSARYSDAFRHILTDSGQRVALRIMETT